MVRNGYRCSDDNMYRVYLDEYVVSWSHDIQGELFYWFEVLDELVTSETVEGVGPTRRVYDVTTKGYI